MLRRGVPVRRVGERLVTTVYDLLLAQYGVARPGLPGEWPAGYDDAEPALHARLAGAAHRHPGGGRRARGARVRAQRRGHRGPLHDHHGLGHQPLVQLRHDLPHDHDAALRLRLHRAQRRRLGALRGAGEDAPLHGLGDARLGPRLEPPPAPELRHGVVLPGHRPVALRGLRRRPPGLAAGARPARRQGADRRPGPGGAARLAGHLPDLRPQSARARRRGGGRRPEPRRLRRRRAPRRPPALQRRGPRRPGQLPAPALRLARQPPGQLRQGPRVLPAPPHGLGPRQHPGDRDAARAAAQGRRLARRGAGRQARPARHHRLPHDEHRAVRRRRAAGRHLVREERPLLHRPAPLRALLQRGHRPALGGALGLGRLQRPGARLLAARGEPARRAPRPRGHGARARHARRGLAAVRRGQGLEGRRGRAGAGQDHAGPDRGRARLRRHPRQADAAWARWSSRSASAPRASPGARTRRSPGWAPPTASSTAAPATDVPRWSAPNRPPRRSSRSRGRPTAASRTTASRPWRSGSACRSPTSPKGSATRASAGRTSRRGRRRR